MYDLHLHSTYSDGDSTPSGLVVEAHRRGLQGLSLTDHNGVWGVAEARGAAQQRGIKFVAGVEVTALADTTDIHILGLGLTLDEAVLREGLRETREGYKERAQQMVQLCQKEGYTKVSFADIVARRQSQTDPCYMAYDVARELTGKHGVQVEAARRLVAYGGACSVPYGSWALTAASAIQLIHKAGGIAVWAHPGLVLVDGGSRERLRALMDELISGQLDGVEAFHPYHSHDVTSELLTLVQRSDLVATGGSDWHGAGRYSLSDEKFGNIGVSEVGFQALLERLP